MRYKRSIKIIVSALTVSILSGAIIYSFFAPKYKLDTAGLTLVLSEGSVQYPMITGVKDDAFRDDPEFLQEDGSYDHSAITQHFGLFEPVFYYSQTLGKDDLGSWLNVEVTSANNKEIGLHFYGTHSGSTIDDRWTIDVSAVDTNNRGTAYRNGTVYEADEDVKKDFIYG